jgi:hypothetical protein
VQAYRTRKRPPSPVCSALRAPHSACL